jgi:hypothetical protein
MHLEELILDGFKSWSVRTTITGWFVQISRIEKVLERENKTGINLSMRLLA